MFAGVSSQRSDQQVTDRDYSHMTSPGRAAPLKNLPHKPRLKSSASWEVSCEMLAAEQTPALGLKGNALSRRLICLQSYKRFKVLFLTSHCCKSQRRGFKPGSSCTPPLQRQQNRGRLKQLSVSACVTEQYPLSRDTRYNIRSLCLLSHSVITADSIPGAMACKESCLTSLLMNKINSTEIER